MTTTTLLRWSLSAGLAAHAAAMLVAPRLWYLHLPGVADTGPYNAHFVRDIGCAFLVAALGLAWRGWRPRDGWPAALAGAGFLLLHGGVHVAETLAGLCGWGALLRDAPLVLLPALLALALALPPRGHVTSAAAASS
ncbi:MAG: hypothetical protein EPO01_18470 [Aquabacterium sp.]|nr:MAG: hypothetical protein EPO01_18470 [Aquabacterium sp.]